VTRHVPAALVILLLATNGAAAATPVTDEAVTAVASQLRCVVCQNLSVADSPSQTARQMRELVRERLVQGDTPEQVIEYFVEKYGEWVLLSPRPRGFTLLVWVLPFAALFAGLGMILLVVVRWSRRAGEVAVAPEPVDRERLRAELEQLED